MSTTGISGQSKYDAWKTVVPDMSETPTKVLARHAPRPADPPTKSDLVSIARWLYSTMELIGSPQGQFYARLLVRGLEREFDR